MMVMGCGSKKAPGDGTDSALDSGDDSATGGDDSGTVFDSAEAASIARGGEIVQEVCSHCHDPSGLAERAAALDDDTITSVIENGFGAMPPQDLDEQQIADVIAYLRANSPNDAPLGRGAPNSSPSAL
jgi:mono/diheme cytochrome c family protein